MSHLSDVDAAHLWSECVAPRRRYGRGQGVGSAERGLRQGGSTIASAENDLVGGV